MADFLDDKRKEIEARLRELKPLVEEYHRLEAAASALAGVGTTSSRSTRSTGSTRRGPGRPRGSGRKPAASGTGRRGRPRGSGKRAGQAAKLVKAKPGITIPELAKEMGIKQNYLYRVMPTLERDGKVVKKDRGFHPA